MKSPTAVLTSTILLALIGYFAFTQWGKPLPFYTVAYDPEMQYFENSLALFKGVSYAYIDHPGTPVEVIGTFLLALTRPITRGADEFFITYHLQHPELFLSLAHGLLFLASLATVVLLAKTALPVNAGQETGARLGIAVAYFTLLAPLTFKALHWWTHNAFNFPFGTLLFVALLNRFRKAEPLRALEVFCFGVLSGILVAVQIYFVAWAAGVVISLTLFTFFNDRRFVQVARDFFLSIFAVVVGFSISFGPVMHRFREFYIWIKDLVFHRGRYGGGEAGFSTPGQMVDNLIWLWNRGEFVFIMSFLGLAMLALAMWWRRREHDGVEGWWALSIGTLSQSILLWVLLAKHPGQNYLLTIAALLPIQLALIFDVLLSRTGAWPVITRATGWFLFLGFFLAMGSAWKSHSDLSAQVEFGETQVAAALDIVQERLGKTREDLVILWGYGVPSRCYALRYGNFSTEGAALSTEIDKICPGEWTYDVWGGYVELPKAYELIAENHDWDLVILPERFLPENAEDLGEIVYTEADTQGYGKLTILISN